jgi:hypothetical protein
MRAEARFVPTLAAGPADAVAGMLVHLRALADGTFRRPAEKDDCRCGHRHDAQEHGADDRAEVIHWEGFRLTESLVKM